MLIRNIRKTIYDKNNKFVLTNLGDSQSAWRTFSAIDGVDGEILWYRLLCPDKLHFLCEENEESEILSGSPYTLTGKTTYDTFQLWSESNINTQMS